MQKVFCFSSGVCLAQLSEKSIESSLQSSVWGIVRVSTRCCVNYVWCHLGVVSPIWVVSPIHCLMYLVATLGFVEYAICIVELAGVSD